MRLQFSRSQVLSFNYFDAYFFILAYKLHFCRVFASVCEAQLRLCVKKLLSLFPLLYFIPL